MSEKQKYKVESKKIDSLKWDDLYKANQEANSAIEDISIKLAQLTKTIQDETDDVEVMKLIDGVANGIVSIKNRVAHTATMHSSEKDGKRYFFSGEVNIDDKKHSTLYLNLISVYMEISRAITEEIADKGITIIMERYNTVMNEKEGK